MNKLSDKATDKAKGGGGEADGGQAGTSGGQGDFLDKGLQNAEQRVAGKYYDEEKMKGANKKITDKIKDKFQSITGHKLPGTH
ncbi:uncharacterized protein BJX67DRAFT_381049 [Aspergillus lucknowensis]|uniref:Uncharacterized protein n=1 Tax=Aspergillus lucknowensis TaxID=176173 RepID=A0ABR4LS13_9EURO